MRIMVIAKHVPDTRIAVRVRADGSGLEEQGLKSVCDPFDEIGIEQAVQLKAALPGIDEVVVMSVGGAAVVETLRHGLAMGADRAVHVVCERIDPHEEMRRAKLCAAAIRSIARGLPSMGFDLILCGARSTDNGAGEFGPALAEFLDLPHAGAVTRLEMDGETIRSHSRCIAGGEQVFEAQLPALITCERGLIEPRTPALPKLMKAKKQPIETIDVKDLGAAGFEGMDARLARLTPPTARQTCRFIEGDPEQAVRELLRLLKGEAKVL